MRPVFVASLMIVLFAPLWLGTAPAQQSSNHIDTPVRDKARTVGNLEVLSDTKGVDFGPYLTEMVKKVRANWYNYIPEEARPPQLKSGETVIEFSILKSGKVAGMKIVQPAGILPMDRAAWGGITASVPFLPLPKEFEGELLALRMHFVYNPAKEDKHGQSAPIPADSKETTSAPH